MYEKTEKTDAFFVHLRLILPGRQTNLVFCHPHIAHCVFMAFVFPFRIPPGKPRLLHSSLNLPLRHRSRMPADSSDKQFLEQIHARKLPSFPQPVGQSSRHLESFRLQETQTGYIIR